MSVVDIHTHIYPPSYISLLKARTAVPYIKRFDDSSGDRLIILPGEDDPHMSSTSRGRPVGPDFWDIERKIKFMDIHGIDISVISLANPWLDFIAQDQAAATAQEVNDDINNLCDEHPGRLYGFGTLPLSASSDIIIGEIKRLKSLKNIRGVIMGTSGLGAGLDDPKLAPVYHTLAESKTLIFLHPHYGLPNELYGPQADKYGHVLPLAIGFPVETTIAIARMILDGVFDRFPDLEVLLAHSGGTLPFLAGRIESCIAHDAHYREEHPARKPVWEILRKNIYLDAVVYSPVGLSAATEASGSDRLMFGTDHPFFPPPSKEDEKWLSVTLNSDAIKNVMESSVEGAKAVMGDNAVRILGLK